MFQNSGDLATHRREKHLDAKSFQCTMCDRTYKRNKALTAHMKAVHLGTKFPCDECTSAFPRSDLMKEWVSKVGERWTFQPS